MKRQFRGSCVQLENDLARLEIEILQKLIRIYLLVVMILRLYHK